MTITHLAGDIPVAMAALGRHDRDGFAGLNAQKFPSKNLIRHSSREIDGGRFASPRLKGFQLCETNVK